MNRETAEQLCALTDEFYDTYADEFSATRQAPWPGWQRCLEEAGLNQDTILPAQRLGLPGATPLTVLDVGCGNLRFLKYVRQQLPAEVQLESFGVDNCERLLPREEMLANEYPYVRFQKLDVLGRIVHEASLPSALEAPQCQVVACFGLMHHTPGVQYRKMLLSNLVQCAQRGGYVMVSFWRFMDCPDLAAAAEQSHQRALQRLTIDPASFESGDYLLGWHNHDEAVRYCHHFTDAEIDELLASLGTTATVEARFTSDGRTGALNTYLVLRATHA